MEQTNKEHKQDCECPMCVCPMHKNCICHKYNGGYGYGVVRWILGILILVFIFSCGMWFGRMSVILRSSGYYGNGYHMMRMWNGGVPSIMCDGKYGWQNWQNNEAPKNPAQ